MTSSGTIYASTVKVALDPSFCVPESLIPRFTVIWSSDVVFKDFPSSSSQALGPVETSSIRGCRRLALHHPAPYAAQDEGRGRAGVYQLNVDTRIARTALRLTKISTVVV